MSPRKTINEDEAREAGDSGNRMGQSYTNLIYHIVFATKDRRPLITGERKQRLYEYLGGIIRNMGGISLGINGMSDHAHVLAKLRPDKAVSDMLRDMKANSSGWMHDVFPEVSDFAWQRGYGAFTVSASQVEKVQRYIAEQEIHHSKCDFRDEFVELLIKNGIEFDERYLDIRTLPPAMRASGDSTLIS